MRETVEVGASEHSKKFFYSKSTDTVLKMKYVYHKRFLNAYKLYTSFCVVDLAVCTRQSAGGAD